jgi:hypothetical protein
MGPDQPTTAAKPRVESTPAVAVQVTPNSLHAVTGAPPSVVFGANGSLGIGGGHTAVGPSAPRATATIPTTVSSDISRVETLFFPTAIRQIRWFHPPQNPRLRFRTQAQFAAGRRKLGATAAW